MQYAHICSVLREDLLTNALGRTTHSHVPWRNDYYSSGLIRDSY